MREPSGSRRVVAIGGGHGLSRTLMGLRDLEDVDITAVVTVADDGGSSGRLRRDFGIIPPGDMRKALSSLVPDVDRASWFEHRFAGGDLAGHSLGNLMIAALAEERGGDMVAALDAIGEWLGCRGRVLPATRDSIGLVAQGRRGTTVGQVAIARSDGHHMLMTSPPDPRATDEAVEAIEAADLVVLGPGSLFTSILATLIVPGIGRAVHATDALVVLIGNVREQPGETEGLNTLGHLDAFARHVPDRPVDVLVLHDGPEPTGPGRTLEVIDRHPHVAKILCADLLDGGDSHDPGRLGQILSDLLGS